MRIYIEEDYEKMSKKAALIVASQIILNPQSVLGLATGSTPVGMYQALVEMYEKDDIDFSEVTTINLDEYYGLSKDNPQSYYSYMMENLFNYINVAKERIHIPNGMARNVVQECLGYEEQIRIAGGIDLQVLGIGANGHIGFNEPSNKLNIRTHLVDLSLETIEDNSRFFENKAEVPRQALSIGIATIMKANQIILLASGASKAEAIREMTSGHLNTQVPASVLQTHPNVSLIIDKDAARLIE
ncbi:glucosamine-6-phosphate isomerase [Alkaliphilus metalliredigens QYMF]|uniref:Glucosamine-6-phosphate deaminase n=1 Tax=Alkaliphilus metalliredigens (strain QYMF) TaxID=293826 RepID=NAGB_ALKMQ|nr:glucosamine-6-phosphate deaminase [Alkaliphilus metalliredigens]A6TVP5.1 RecName: Full=Glucosamine-6-phosphate deaminase; AltName: Full=GlcN6P deaminase; Short=GNPDA; AltName: Full=Glucosamine-6-phosphate isomerase [Alkaliphilus metalliredigens QYMF]ABR50263.1 glucosamine-6-phosphate isomerase [Alkaliphilus metalliredigens QYMF]